MKHLLCAASTRRPALTLSCAALAGLLTACGGSGEPAVTAPVVAAPATEAAAPSQVALAAPVLQQRSAATAAATPTAAAGSFSLFANGQYGAGVSNWSWNLCNTSPTAKLGGLTVLYFNECQGGNWGSGGYLHLDTPMADAVTLQFDVYLGTKPAATAAQISLAFGDGSSGVALSSLLPSPKANAWNAVKLDLRTVLNGLAFQHLMLMNASGHPKFYLNNVTLLTTTGSPGDPGAGVAIAIDAAANVHDISPLVYGVAAFDNVAPVLSGLNSPINRHGGNATSAYNWQLNASGRGADWYFESVPEDGGSTPAGALASLVQANRQAGAQSMITVPMLNWVAKLGPNRSKLASFSVAKYGAQQQTDAQWMPDAGNGVRLDGSLLTGNDPADAHTAADEAFQSGLVRSLTQQFGTAGAGGVRYYILDNEHSIWHSTHRDVQPQGAGMDEVAEAIRRYAGMVRAADPSAQIVGPEEWGWAGYLFSGKDLQAANWSNPPDKTAHGGMDYMPWLLQKIRQQETASGTRLLDVFSLHYYPQSGEYSSNVSTTTQQLRNVSTRSLWDPNFTDKSWINDKVRLIPRMKDWVRQYAPGLKIAITEYSWGADSHINGATTQADVLGIFGREGVDIATRWTAPPEGSPTFKAFQMYRNYDGQKSTFGDRSVQAAVPNPDQLAAFAALRSSDNALTVMVINKDLVAQHPVTLKLANFGGGAGSVQRWQLTKANSIIALAALSYSGAQVTDTVPAQSVTLYVIR